MSPCRRFEEEALERIERGLPLDSHFDGCPDCLKAREEYSRLRELLASEAAQIAPPAGWQDAVWEHVEKRTPWWKLAGSVAAAALVGVLIWITIPGGTVTTTLNVTTENGGDVMRSGSEVQVGSTIRIRADVDRERAAELRIYLDDDELLVRCSDLDPCRRSGDLLEVEQIVEVRGRYEVLLIVSEGELPPPAGSLDADVGAAEHTGAKYLLSKPITAR